MTVYARAVMSVKVAKGPQRPDSGSEAGNPVPGRSLCRSRKDAALGVLEPGAEQEPADLAGLVDAARAGDEAAWERLVDLYGPRVFALARSRLRHADLAEEVTQSVFATIAHKLGGGDYVENGKFEPWLFRIAMNRVRDSIRQARREHDERRLRLAASSGEVHDTASEPISPERLRLRGAMAELSPRDRDILELRYHAGLSFRQMVDLLGEPLGTLLARHHRALKKLRRVMESDESGTTVNERLTEERA